MLTRNVLHCVKCFTELNIDISLLWLNFEALDTENEADVDLDALLDISMAKAEYIAQRDEDQEVDDISMSLGG